MPVRHSFHCAWLCVAFFATTLLCGCASTYSKTLNDPFEQTNRAIYRLNSKFNNNVTLPIAWVYVNYVPGGVRRGVHNALSNVEAPVTFANDLLQGEVTNAGETLARFILNSSLGLGGFIDIAARQGLPPHESDFDQTLALYGVKPGPFLVLPIFGPSTPRGLLGASFDLAVDPLIYLPADWLLLERVGMVVGIHTAGPFEQNATTIVLRRQLAKDSLDPYATMRSIYRQQRTRALGGSREPIIPPDGE